MLIKTQEKSTIKADYVKYNKKWVFKISKTNIVATDIKNNIIKTNYAEYNEKDKGANKQR